MVTYEVVLRNWPGHIFKFRVRADNIIDARNTALDMAADMEKDQKMGLYIVSITEK